MAPYCFSMVVSCCVGCVADYGLPLASFAALAGLVSPEEKYHFVGSWAVLRRRSCAGGVSWMGPGRAGGAGVFGLFSIFSSASAIYEF